MSSAAAIRHYYERNTRWFLRFGSSPEAQSIHRAVWEKPSDSLADALHYSHRFVLGELQTLGVPAPRVVDLGCGVGGSLYYLAERLDPAACLVGLTLSPLQARLAQTRRPPAPARCHFLEGDFTAVPLAAGMDGVFSIEAFIHASSAEAYVREAARLLRPRGRWIVVDDFRTARRATGYNWVPAYQHGWHAPNLCRVPELETLALVHGLRLIADHDLTPALRLRALPDPLAAGLHAAGQRLPIPHPLWPSTLGSLALQQSLKLGLIEYHALVWEKQ